MASGRFSPISKALGMPHSFVRRFAHRLVTYPWNQPDRRRGTFMRLFPVRPARVVFHAARVDIARKAPRPTPDIPFACTRTYRGHSVSKRKNSTQTFRLFEEPSGRELFVSLKTAKTYQHRIRVLVTAWYGFINGRWVPDHSIRPLGRRTKR